MRITVTGGTGLIGRRLVAALRDRGDEVTVLSRSPKNARRVLVDVEAVAWNPEADPAPVDGLAGRDGVVHLAGEPIAQRWTHESKERIRASREQGTARLVEGLDQSEPRPRVLVSASAVGYYGARGEERLDEDASPGTGFLASVCEAWERAAAAATRLDLRTVSLRTGVLLDRADGALADAPAFPARRWRPRRRRRPVHLVDRPPTTSSVCIWPRSTTRSGPARSTPPHPSR